MSQLQGKILVCVFVETKFSAKKNDSSNDGCSRHTPAETASLPLENDGKGRLTFWEQSKMLMSTMRVSPLSRQVSSFPGEKQRIFEVGGFPDHENKFSTIDISIYIYRYILYNIMISQHG